MSKLKPSFMFICGITSCLYSDNCEMRTHSFPRCIHSINMHEIWYTLIWKTDSCRIFLVSFCLEANYFVRIMETDAIPPFSSRHVCTHPHTFSILDCRVYLNINFAISHSETVSAAQKMRDISTHVHERRTPKGNFQHGVPRLTLNTPKRKRKKNGKMNCNPDSLLTQQS